MGTPSALATTSLPRVGRPADDWLTRLRRHLVGEVWTAAGLDHDRADEYGWTRDGAWRRCVAQPPWASDTTANLLAALMLAGAWADGVGGGLERCGA